MNNSQEEFLGELRLGRKLTNLGQTAAGGLVIFLGLIFLLADPILAIIGTRAALAGLLVILVLLLTAVSVVELLGGSGERGGTYVLVHEILGGWSAFLTGWGLLAGSVLALAGLLNMAAVQLVEMIPSFSGEPRAVALFLLAFLVITQIFQLSPRGIPLTTVVILLSILLVLLLITTLPDINLALFRNTPRLQISTLNRAVALLSILYVTIEFLLSSRRLIRDPGKHLPGAIFTTMLIGGIILILVFFILSGIDTPFQLEGSHLINDLAVAGFLPLALIRLLIFSFLVLAANGCLMTATRQLNLFSLEGAVPAELRRMMGPVPMPILLFFLNALFATPLILFVDQARMITLAAGLFLLVMVALNFAVIYSLRTEPKRRRFFVVPFAPLVPALAIVLNLVILRALPGDDLLWAFVWLAFGVVYYFIYARYHQVQAQEGEVVFGRVGPVRTREARYRILVPVASGEERQIALRVATSLSHQLKGEVIPLQIIEVPDPLAIEEGRRVARERNTLFRWSTRIGDSAGVPIHPITRLARNISEGIIDTAVEEDCNLVLLSWAINRQDTEARIGQVLNTVVREAPCDVLVMAYKKELLQDQLQSIESGDGRTQEAHTTGGEFRFHPTQILVPTSGGPNAPLGIRLALLLAREFDAKVTTIYGRSAGWLQCQCFPGRHPYRRQSDSLRECRGWHRSRW
ncbi:MAG: universal stress protein [Anaerolineales bacterium]